jgi:hypothetical protein
MTWLQEYIDYKGISVNAFEKSIDTRSTIGKAIANNSNLRSDILAKIIEVYKDINPKWLLSGKGEMLQKGVTTKNVVTNDFDADTILTLLELLFFHEKELIEKYPMYAKWAQRKELRAYNDGAEAMKNKLEGN